MAAPYHHALSSVKKWGGIPEDYLPIHNWFDATKAHHADFRHRALRHHAEGIFLMESIFGVTMELATCARCGQAGTSHHFDIASEVHAFKPKVIPTRWVGEQHVKEDLGLIPPATAWLACIRPEPWMSHAQKLSVELEWPMPDTPAPDPSEAPTEIVGVDRAGREWPLRDVGDWRAELGMDVHLDEPRTS